MSKGYFNDKDLTKESFVQNPFCNEKEIIYKTGDFGYYNKDLILEVLGRSDRQIKINGVRV